MSKPLVLDTGWRDHVESPFPDLVAAVSAAPSPLLEQPLDPRGLRIQD